MMGVGDKITLLIPAHLAYGDRGIPNLIPPGSDLIFNLEITEIVE
jgi:FKBP-type peptidyl-prolyl cis-trans isomerase